MSRSRPGVPALVVPMASPKLNVDVNRLFKLQDQRCLAKFVIFGKRHLNCLVAKLVEYDNCVRSSMVSERVAPTSESPDEVATISLDDAKVMLNAGGLVKGFEREAACMLFRGETIALPPKTVMKSWRRHEHPVPCRWLLCRFMWSRIFTA